MTRLLRTAPAFGALAGLAMLGSLAGCAASTEQPAGGAQPGTGGAASYHDGSYSAEGEYLSPEGKESIGVKLTLESDLVTAVTITPHATNGNAASYQNDFAGGIAGVVVGKDIDTLQVSRVAGSSLTSTGFNKAVESIKADARG